MKTRNKEREREAERLLPPSFTLVLYSRVCICVFEQRKGKSKPRLCFSRTCFNVIVVRIFTILRFRKRVFEEKGGEKCQGERNTNEVRIKMDE